MKEIFSKAKEYSYYENVQHNYIQSNLLEQPPTHNDQCYNRLRNQVY